MSMKCYIKKIIIKGFNAWQARIVRFMAEVAYSLKQPCVRVCYYAGSAAGAKRNQKQDLFYGKKNKIKSAAPFPPRMAAPVPPPSSSVPSLINDVVCLIYDPPQQIRVSLFNLLPSRQLPPPPQKAQPHFTGNIRELLNKHSYVMSLPILSSS